VAKLADAADLGSEPPQPESPSIEKTRQFDDPNCPEKGGVRTALGQSWGNPRASAVAELYRRAASLADVGDMAGASDPPPNLEVLLAQALRLAAVAGRWEIVAQLAREIEARRAVAPTNAHVGREAKRAQDCYSTSQNSTTKEKEREG
jgi:hypothetical protein